MSEPRESIDLDAASAADVVGAVLDGQRHVLDVVRAATADIARAADLVAAAWRHDGRLILVGAGTSGRVAWQEAAELPGTFGLPPDRVVASLAGGVGATDTAEDDLAAAARDLGVIAPTAADVVVAVAASGSTPYTVAFARDSAPAPVIAVVTVPGSPLERAAAVTIRTEVGDEVLRGSTRLGAGTAQKLVLDALTTAAAARFGRVHGVHMIDVVPANAKLRERSARIVAAVSDRSPEDAAAALDVCDGDARAAVLVLVRGLDPSAARALAARYESLREALDS